VPGSGDSLYPRIVSPSFQLANPNDYGKKGAKQNRELEGGMPLTLKRNLHGGKRALGGLS
jgi:hypothetical protein